MYSNGSNILKFKMLNQVSHLYYYQLLFKKYSKFPCIFLIDFIFILYWDIVDNEAVPYIFQSSFRFTVNCQEGREFSFSPPSPHPWLPYFQYPLPESDICYSSWNSLTHQYHPKITVSIRFILDMYGLDRWINDIYPLL